MFGRSHAISVSTWRNLIAMLKARKFAQRIAHDIAQARRDGVTATPTLLVDGVRYDGAWDFYSLLDVLERPVAQRIQRSARAFANLPASGGLVLVLAAVAALVCANTPLAPYYRAFVEAPFGIGPPGSLLSLTRWRLVFPRLACLLLSARRP